MNFWTLLNHYLRYKSYHNGTKSHWYLVQLVLRWLRNLMWLIPNLFTTTKVVLHVVWNDHDASKMSFGQEVQMHRTNSPQKYPIIKSAPSPLRIRNRNFSFSESRFIAWNHQICRVSKNTRNYATLRASGSTWHHYRRINKRFYSPAYCRIAYVEQISPQFRPVFAGFRRFWRHVRSVFSKFTSNSSTFKSCIHLWCLSFV